MLLELMLAIALSAIVLTVAVTMVYIVEKDRSVSTSWYNLQYHSELITQILCQEFKFNLIDHIVIANNNVRFNVSRYEQGQQKKIVESIFLRRHTLYMKISNQRSEALISNINSFVVSMDHYTNAVGLAFTIKFDGKYLEKVRPWHLYLVVTEAP